MADISDEGVVQAKWDQTQGAGHSQTCYAKNLWCSNTWEVTEDKLTSCHRHEASLPRC